MELAHARWLICESRILRLYVATVNPSENLVSLATYVVKIYTPVWFTIKKNNLCSDGARNLWHLIQLSRCMNKSNLNHIDPVIQRNAYFAHPENILLCMIADPKQHIRELALRRILKARHDFRENEKPNIRTFKIPVINFQANNYFDIINWQDSTITEPPVISNITDEALKEAIQTGGRIEVPKFPCHTQAVERSIKLVTEASTSVCGQIRRDGYIRTKLQSQNLMPSFETKKDYKF